MNETIATTFAAGPRSSSRIYSPTSARKEWVLATPSRSASPSGGGHVAKASKTPREQSPRNLASASKQHHKMGGSTKVLSKEDVSKPAKADEGAKGVKKEGSSKSP
ncbi:hypothetical protein MRX96_008411 [Rhipicephalus microplus]